MKFQILTAHLQDMSIHSYPRVSINKLFTLEIVDVVQVTLQKNRTSFFDPDLTPRGKMKISKSNCASTGHGKMTFSVV